MGNKIVLCEVVGGLGNQLFCVAAALEYAKQTGRKCLFLQNWASTPRPFYWHNLLLRVPTCLLNQWEPLKRTAKQHVDWAPGHRPIPAYSDQDIVQLSGYFQSAKYFPSLETWKPILFPKELMEFAKKQLEGKDWAFMHVRRGDYKHLQAVHNILPVDYYEKASQQFPKEVAFLVFVEQEDLLATQKDFKTLGQQRSLTFVDHRIPDYIQLLMMAQCTQGGIVANSSFSVWAAYLHPPHHTIVAPRQWFTQIQNADLPLPHWTRI